MADPIRIHDHILRLDIPMNNRRSQLMQKIQQFCQLDQIIECLVLRDSRLCKAGFA